MFICSDSFRLKQILSNLIDNSIKFTKQGIIEIGYEVDAKNLVLYVKDSGLGIAKKNHAIIFEKFRKIDEDKTILYRGVGIGLTISKELANLLGAELLLKSTLREGTTFYLEFNNEHVT